MKLSILQQSAVSLTGGLLGWSLGKLLDTYVGGDAIYGILALLALCVIYLVQS